MLWQKLMGANAVVADPIQYVGGSVDPRAGTSGNITVSLTSLSGGVATAPEAGDLVIVYFATGSTLDRNLVVSGYTEITELYSNGVIDTNFVAAYKFMGATPDTTVTLTGGTLSTADAGTIIVQVWRNVNATNPFDVTVQTSTLTTSVLANPPSITSASKFAVVLAAGAGAGDLSLSTPTLYLSSDLVGFRRTSSGDTNDSMLGAGYKQLSTPQTFDPSAFTTQSGSNSTDYSSAALTTALRPISQPARFPQFVASASNGNNDDVTIDVPAGTLEGYLMVAVLGIDTAGSGVTWTPPAGWTEVVDQGTLNSLAVMYKVAGASEPASYTFNASGAGVPQAGSILTFKEAAYDTVGTLVANTTNTSYTLPAITASENYNLVLAIGTGMNATSAPVSSWTMNTAGFDKIQEYENFTRQVHNIVYGMYFGPAGSSGDVSISYSLTSGTANSAAVLLALKPA